MASHSSKFDPVVVVGGGFGGLTTALALSQFDHRPQIILIEPKRKFVFFPLLYELLSGELHAWEVAPSYRSLLSESGISLIEDFVENIDTNAKTVITASGLLLTYSQVVLGTGSVPSTTCEVPGLRRYALTFHSLEDVDRLRKRIHEIEQCKSLQKALVIIGAGSTGVELACKLADLLQGVCDIHLIDLAKRVLPNGKSFNQEQTEHSLTKRGVRVHLQTRVLSISSDQVSLERREGGACQSFSIAHSGLVWTGGTRPFVPTVFPEVPLKKGRLPIDEYLQVVGLKNVFALGDAAFHEQENWPVNAQVAIQQGKAAAKIVMEIQADQSPSRFEFFDFGEMLSLGIGNATFTGMGLTLSGPLAFQLRRMAYLVRMPRLSLGVRSAAAWLLGN